MLGGFDSLVGAVVGGPRDALLDRGVRAATGRVEHTDGTISDDPTIGCCWDADRLDLPRVGMQPDPALLSTEAAARRIRSRQ